MKIAHQSGISLIEILVTLTIVSILGALAAPNIQAFLQNSQIRSVTDEFVSSLYRTRSEAVKRGNRVTICASNAAQTDCDPAANSFSDGWIVFTDYDDSGTLTANTTLFDTTGDGVNDTAEEILHVSGAPSGNFEIVTNSPSPANNRRLTYRSNGLVSGSAMFSYLITDTATSDQHARIYLNTTGRIRQCIGGTTKCN